MILRDGIRDILKVYFLQVGAAVFVGAVSFFLTIFIARSIGPESFGVYSVALASGSFALIFLDGGLRTLMLRERSRLTEGFFLSKDQLPRLAIAHTLGAASLLYIFAIFLLDGFHLQLALATISCFLIVALNQINSSILRGDGKIFEDACFQCLSRLITAIAIVMVILLGWKSPLSIFSTWAVFGFLVIIGYRKLWGWPSFSATRKIYPILFPFFIFELAITIYIRSDILVLNHFGFRSEDIGQYAAAFRICEAFVLGATPIGLIIFRYFRGQDATYSSLVRKLTWLLVVSICFSAVFVGVVFHSANLITEIAFGEKYPSSAYYLRMMAFMIFFVLPNMILNQFSLASGRERICMYTALFVSAINFIALLLFVPKYGISAAAYLKVISEATVFLVMATSMFGGYFFSGKRY